MSAGADQRYLAKPQLARFWTQARAAYERTGGRRNDRGRLAGSFSVPALTGEEAFAIAGLVGHRSRRQPAAGGTHRVTLAVLEEVLRDDTEFPPLPETLELLGGPLDLQPQRRQAEAAAEDAFWEWARSHPACADPRIATWVRELQWEPLAAWARRNDGYSLRLALDAAELVQQRAPIELASLAATVGPHPHCLDHGRTAGTLLVSLLGWLDESPFPAGAVERRALLMRCGVLPDLISPDALCIGLRPTGDGPVTRMLAGMASRHVKLTYAHLSSERLTFAPGLVVRTCENPVLVARAEQLPDPPPLVCTAGQRTSAVALLLDMLCDAGAEIRHHGDFDAGGLAIASVLARDHAARPWRYDSREYLKALTGLSDRPASLAAERLEVHTQGPFGTLAAVMRERLVAVYEEDVLDTLVSDLAANAPAVPRPAA